MSILGSLKHNVLVNGRPNGNKNFEIHFKNVVQLWHV